MTRFLRTAALCALVLGLAPSAYGQSVSERVELERFRDSLSAVTDTVSLLALERSMIERARADRDNPMMHLRLGFLAVRVGDLGGRSHYDDAASEFQWATELRPNWPYGWYGLGLAEYGVGDSQISIVAGLKTMLGKDALTRSANAYAKSAEVDPGFVHGLVELAETALRQRVNIKLTVALDALRRAADTETAHDPRVLLVRGRVERAVGDADSALMAFHGYLERGGRLGLGQLEVARTEFVRGSFDGIEPYYAGAREDDPVTIDAYRADLAVIAGDSVLEAFDKSRGGARAAVLRNFWDRRDQRDLRRSGERLREHYRRLYYARRNFALVSLNRHYSIEEVYRSGSRDFDDRGVIYIRHGEPADRASYQAIGLEPNESWRYIRPDGDLVFHFVAREDVSDFKLVESVFDVLGFSTAVQLRGSGTAVSPVASGLLLSRENLSPLYSRLQSAGAVGSGRYQAQERSLGRRSIAVGTTSDSYELRFSRELKAETDVLAVGTSPLGGMVQATFAIPGSSMDPVPTSRGSLYPVRLRMTVMNTAGAVVGQIDTTRLYVSQTPVGPREYLVGRVEVPVPPGLHSYRLAVQEGDDAGVVLPTDTVRVGSGRDGIALSDLVVGLRARNVLWQPAGQSDTVFFNPLGTFQARDEMELYYEVYGLEENQTFRTEIAVKKGSGGGGGLFGAIGRLFGGGGAAIEVAFPGRATGGVTSVQRTIDLSKLKPGNYTIEVRVANEPEEAAREVVRRRRFQIVP